jgi:calcineurin-like phosphoesterase family protein
MIYFTADLHLSHEKIISYCHRPFKSPKEMDDCIFSNFKDIVKKGDTLYILGDLSFDRGIGTAFLKMFKKDQLRYILGNHDEAFPKEYMLDYCKTCTEIKDIKVEGQKITLCHYAMRTWRGSGHNTWQLYGHSHGKLEGKGKQFDVGVDTHNFKPYSFEEVKAIMETKDDNEDYLIEERVFNVGGKQMEMKI